MAGHDHGLPLRGVEAGDVDRRLGMGAGGSCGEGGERGLQAEGQRGDPPPTTLKMTSRRWHSP